MKLLTYEEWCEYITPKIYYNGKLYHNCGATKDLKFYVEDWIKGERIFFEIRDSDFNVTIPRDPRIRNFQYDTDIMDEYKAIGADKWKYPEWPAKDACNPPPPLDTLRIISSR